MPPSSARPAGRTLQVLTLVHAGILLAATTWGFGGNAHWIRPWLAAWASLSLPLLLAASRPGAALAPSPLRWLWPFALFNALALLACLTPGSRLMTAGADTVLIPLRVPDWRPSAALPGLALPDLWLFDGVFLSAFNLALVVTERRFLRAFLLFATGNAVALAIFGTLQKLSGATGLYFGLVKSPQSYFFASFIYDNHWGAFAVLMSALALGLVWRYTARSGPDHYFRTPAFAGLVAILLLAVTVPLSGARLCTLLLLALLGSAGIRALLRSVRSRRREHAPLVGPLAGGLSAAVLGIGAIWYLAGETIERRLAKTQEQLAAMHRLGGIGDRAALYRNTVRMARDRPWFGWGAASYPHVFMLYNTQKPNPIDHLPVFYHDAHSDWLQALAEHGLVGTLLLGLCAAVPLASTGGRELGNPISACLLAGCALILLYGAIEFPFGNLAVQLCWWLCLFVAVAYARLVRAARARPSP